MRQFEVVEGSRSLPSDMPTRGRHRINKVQLPDLETPSVEKAGRLANIVFEVSRFLLARKASKVTKPSCYRYWFAGAVSVCKIPSCRTITMRLPTPILLVILVSAASSASPADFKSRCEALGQGVEMPSYNGTSVTIAQYLPKNTTIDQFTEGTNATCTFPNPTTRVNLCRVALRIPTSNASEVYMEAWLPEQWNSRFLAVGTGGLAGCELFWDSYHTSNQPTSHRHLLPGARLRILLRLC